MATTVQLRQIISTIVLTRVTHILGEATLAHVGVRIAAYTIYRALTATFKLLMLVSQVAKMITK
jgi:hypothetical protein